MATGKITDFIKFDTGTIAMVTGGRNMGRVGVVTHRERHDGGFNIVHIKDAIDNSFATRESNVFIIGQEKPWISLPKGKGVKVSFLYLCNLLNLPAYECDSYLSPKNAIVGVLTPSQVIRKLGERGEVSWWGLELVAEVWRRDSVKPDRM